MKRRGETHSENAEYRDIEMPRNTAIGFWLGGLAFVLGFALIWHIWWLVGSAFLGMLGAVILRSFDDHTEYRIPAAEVARLEQLRRDRVSPANESTLASDLQPVDSSR
jgi:cytochrome o ubiquinol oxidase subunit 1